MHTRFPPEPNGYLHIGHAKALCIDFGIAEDYGGLTNLRYDDTNPVKEDVEYVDAIKEDIHWLGFDWGDREYYASDYFEPLYEMALQLIEKGLAYVDELSPDEMREYRGTLTEPGKNSPGADDPSKRTLICSSACATANSRMAVKLCGQRSTWHRPTSTCATR